MTDELGWSDRVEQIKANRQPVVTRHDDGTITMEWPEGQLSTLVSREVLEGMIFAHNADRDFIAHLEGEKADLEADVGHHRLQISHLLAQLAQLRDSERPCVFMPGDRVVCLIGAKLEGATVQKVQIPGPINPDQVIQVFMDEVQPGQLTSMLWFNPVQLERFSG